MRHQKRVAAIHDISGFGKCSLTVALPIISAAGIECSVMPTAVLSTHTGGFEGFTYRDLTGDLRPFADHWKLLNLTFDALYTGFLGSFEQLEIVSGIFDDFRTDDNLILVDPVMADNGALYKIFPSDFPLGMKKLCAKADIIIPNITEAALLLEEPYREGPYTEGQIERVLKSLSDTGPAKVVLTGVFFDNNTLGAATYDRNSGRVGYAFSERIPGYFHGTGDVFGSVLLSALLNNFDLTESAQIAVDFTTDSIRRTAASMTDIRFGVRFEDAIPGLLKRLGAFQTRRIAGE
ncbi:MAG: pyridoxamine kinase [Dysgonamonadaceae bacterium]|nr:pyridoxamine kinase [Dysgonamonadaceae bacterium]